MLRSTIGPSLRGISSNGSASRRRVSGALALSRTTNRTAAARHIGARAFSNERLFVHVGRLIQSEYVPLNHPGLEEKDGPWQRLGYQPKPEAPLPNPPIPVDVSTKYQLPTPRSTRFSKSLAPYSVQPQVVKQSQHIATSSPSQTSTAVQPQVEQSVADDTNVKINKLVSPGAQLAAKSLADVSKLQISKLPVDIEVQPLIESKTQAAVESTKLDNTNSTAMSNKTIPSSAFTAEAHTVASFLGDTIVAQRQHQSTDTKYTTKRDKAISTTMSNNSIPSSSFTTEENTVPSLLAVELSTDGIAQQQHDQSLKDTKCIATSSIDVDLPSTDKNITKLNDTQSTATSNTDVNLQSTDKNTTKSNDTNITTASKTGVSPLAKDIKIEVVATHTVRYARRVVRETRPGQAEQIQKLSNEQSQERREHRQQLRQDLALDVKSTENPPLRAPVSSWVHPSGRRISTVQPQQPEPVQKTSLEQLEYLKLQQHIKEQQYIRERQEKARQEQQQKQQLQKHQALGNKSPSQLKESKNTTISNVANPSFTSDTKNIATLPGAQLPSAIDDGSESDSAVYTCLLLAVREGNVQLARHLIGSPLINPGARDSAALQLAAANGNTELVKLFLSDGRSDPTVMENAALSLAFQSQRESSAEVVRLLIADTRVNPLAVGIKPLLHFFNKHEGSNALDVIVDKVLDVVEKEDYVDILPKLLSLKGLDLARQPRLEKLLADLHVDMLCNVLCELTNIEEQNANLIAHLLSKKADSASGLSMKNALKYFVAERFWAAFWVLLDNPGVDTGSVFVNRVLINAASANETDVVAEWLKRYGPALVDNNDCSCVAVSLLAAMEHSRLEVIRILVDWNEKDGARLLPTTIVGMAKDMLKK